MTALTLPTASGGNPPLKYTLTTTTPGGSLPTWLTFDDSERTLTGTPNATQAATSYTYTATDADGDSTNPALTFTITVGAAPAPTPKPKPALISEIEPAFRGVSIYPGEPLRLRTRIFGLQGIENPSLGDDVDFSWQQIGGGVTRGLDGTGSSILYRAPSQLGTYRVSASLTRQDCTSLTPSSWNAADCTAEFEVRVARRLALVEPPAPPVNPPGPIPSVVADEDGEQHGVFTPEDGGTYSGTDYSVTARPGAVGNDELVGIRIVPIGPVGDFTIASQRLTPLGTVYEAYVVDASGTRLSSYTFNSPGVEICIPLPHPARANIDAADLTSINADDSLSAYSSSVKIVDDRLRLCGNVSLLPQRIVAATSALVLPAPTPEAEIPETGGRSPSTTPLLILLLLGLVAIAFSGFVLKGATSSRQLRQP